MSTDLVAANPLEKITKDSYNLAEKHFSGTKKRTREYYLDEIDKLIGQYLDYEAISDDTRKQLEKYREEFKDLRKFKVRADEQAPNEFSNLGKKSNRHSNAFFAVSMEMLNAELEHLGNVGAPRASISNRFQKLAESLDDRAPEKEINDMIDEIRSEITSFTPTSDQSYAVLQAKVTGLQKSFFDNCTHKIRHDGTAWKDGGQGRYETELKPFLERAMGIGDHKAMTYAHYPNNALGWLRLAHMCDVEREWVVIGLAYSTLEQTFEAKNEHDDLCAIRHLKRRHFQNAPDYIKFYVKTQDPELDDKTGSCSHDSYRKRQRAPSYDRDYDYV